LDPIIRFLTHEELEALLRAVDDPEFGRVDYPLFLVAATCGLRQGELVALRWRRRLDRRCHPRPPQLHARPLGRCQVASVQSPVPTIARTAGALDRHFKSSRFQADDDLVFAGPELGSVLDASKLRKRFKTTLAAAGVRPHTFGTQAAASGVPLRTLQEWMGHRDYKTTLIYADYAPRAEERQMMERAFATASVL
jgi:integrase